MKKIWWCRNCSATK